MTKSDPLKTSSATTPSKPAETDRLRDLAIEKLARKQARVGQTVLGPKT